MCGQQIFYVLKVILRDSERRVTIENHCWGSSDNVRSKCHHYSGGVYYIKINLMLWSEYSLIKQSIIIIMVLSVSVNCKVLVRGYSYHDIVI